MAKAPKRSVAKSAVALNDEMWFVIADARARMRAAMNADEVLTPLQLSLRTYAVLSLACTGNAYSQREIARMLSFDSRQVVYLVDELEGLGLIERRPDERDRRVNAIVATPAGEQVYATASASIREREEVPLQDLSAAERRTLQDLLARIGA